MSTRLEQFIRDNREHFDSEEPDPKVWQKLQQGPVPGQRKGIVIAMNRVRWRIAAAVVVFAAGLATWFALIRTNPPGNDIAQTKTGNPAPDTPDILKQINPGYAEEVYHFTRLIELKQTELKQIENSNPDLYKKFSVDIDRLDSSYNVLKKELATNPNREKLLQAMIQNLQLQSGLLNQQLEILREIKQTKNKKDEHTGKTT